MQRKYKVVGSVGVGVVIGTFALALLVLANTSGSILPTSDGAHLQWTPKSGSTHYTMVDESSCNGNTDYNHTATVGNRDSYGVSLSSVPDGATITAIAIGPCASRDSNGSGSATMDVFYRWNGTDSSDAGNYSLSGTTPANLATTTFSGLALTKVSTSALEVGAVYSSGTKGARLSRIVVVITYAPVTPPTAPSNLVATNVSGSQNNLTWTDNSSNETGFKIERHMNNVFPWVEIASTTANVISYSDTGLTADQTYYYRVRATNSGGDSAYSNTASAITETVVPANPSNLSAIATTSTPRTVSLFWIDHSNNEEGFSIERGNDGVSFSQIATTTSNTTFYSDGTVVSGSTYYYRVAAVNSIGSSGYTNVASTTIP